MVNSISRCLICHGNPAYTCLHACLYTCLHTCAYPCLHTCLYTCLHSCLYTCLHTCLYTCPHTCMYICLYTCLHTCLYTCLHTCLCAKFKVMWTDFVVKSSRAREALPPTGCQHKHSEIITDLQVEALLRWLCSGEGLTNRRALRRMPGPSARFDWKRWCDSAAIWMLDSLGCSSQRCPWTTPLL